MRHVFLITKEEQLAAEIKRYLLNKEHIQAVATTLTRYVGGTNQESRAYWVPHAFNKVADWLETSAEQASLTKFGLFNSICLIEVPTLADLAELDPIDRTTDWSAVVGMLILAFPEIIWGLITPYKSQNKYLDSLHLLEKADLWPGLDHLTALQRDGFSSLFDAGGFRSMLRDKIRRRAEAQYLPVRSYRALSIDEELSYAYFNAYVAYRFGFRCDVITSYHRMTSLLATDGDSITVALEDIYLNFPDRRMSMSQLEERDKKCPVLASIPNRIFVTSGHSRTKHELDTRQGNEKYLAGLTANKHYYTKTLYKPGSGVFDLWKKSGLRDQFMSSDGKAPDFIWPPTIMDQEPAASNAAQKPVEGTHSSPGRLLMVAERLIQRASHINRELDSADQAIYGATLALEAQEYLGYRTPTTSLDAIALKHQLEVAAECMFYGIEYHLDTKSRFDEIEKEVDRVGTWFREKTRETSELNAEIGMVSDLVLTFRDHNQFSEEQAALTRLRTLHRRLWVQRHRPWSWIIWPVRWYLDTLLASIPRFLIAILCWIGLFGIIYANVPVQIARGGTHGLMLHGLEDAIAAFFGMQPPHDFVSVEQAGQLMVWVTLFIIVMGFVHLGIFVSHLYSIMARR